MKKRNARRAKRRTKRQRGARVHFKVDFKNLQYFVVVFEQKSISRAAEVLSTTQSAVSVRIRTVEKAHGAKLFERRWRTLEPTQAAERLYADVRVAIAAYQLTDRYFPAAQVA